MVLFAAGMNIDSIAQLLSLIIVFIIVLVLAYYTSKFAGSFQSSRLSSGNIRIIETMRISNNKYLMIINVGDRYILTAVGKDSVTYLCELDSDKLNISEHKENGEEFKKIFAKLKSSNKVDNNEKEI